MSDDTVTVRQLLDRIAAMLMAEFEGKMLVDEELITVERDKDNPERLNCTFPTHWDSRIVAGFYEYPEPIGCRR